MKKAALALLVITLSSPAAFAADPCATVLCMAGKVMGKSGGSSCSGPESAFFSILEFDPKGIDWKATVKARRSFLKRCSSPDPQGWVSKIISQFGRSRG